MGYKLIIKPEAEQELHEALDWYEQQKMGLGLDFFHEITHLFHLIQANPNHYQKRYRDFRISFTKRFPYGVHYTVTGSTIFIHAVLHTKRKPR